MQDRKTLEDEEFRRELKRVLMKPMKWSLERADRALRGAVRDRQRTFATSSQRLRQRIRGGLSSPGRDPESFPENLRQLEEVIDLKAKIC